MEAEGNSMLEHERNKVSPCNWSWRHHHSQPTPSLCRHMGHTDHQSSASSLSRWRSKSARSIRTEVSSVTCDGEKRQQTHHFSPSVKESKNHLWGSEEKVDWRVGRAATHKGPPLYSSKFLLLHIPSPNICDGKTGREPRSGWHP